MQQKAATDAVRDKPQHGEAGGHTGSSSDSPSASGAGRTLLNAGLVSRGRFLSASHQSCVGPQPTQPQKPPLHSWRQIQGQT